MAQSLTLCSECQNDLQSILESSKISFCPYCSNQLAPSPKALPSSTPVVSHRFQKGQQLIGRYKIEQFNRFDGTDEIYTAEDLKCNRSISIRTLQKNFAESDFYHHLFIKEIEITSKLSHPYILTLFSAHHEKGITFSTTPIFKGESIREILAKTEEQITNQEPLHPIGGSIPALTQIFLKVCQTVQYIHSKGIAHCQLNGSTILVGKFDDVKICDWKLASEEKEFDKDLYALGELFYSMLTLKQPFYGDRSGISSPDEKTPYRFIPKILSDISLKLLAKEEESRYEKIEQVIYDLEIYFDERVDWYPLFQFDLENQLEWSREQYQKLPLSLSDSSAPPRSPFFSYKLHRESYSENFKLSADLYLEESSPGVGLILSCSKELDDGFLLWISADKQVKTTFYRSGSEVISREVDAVKHSTWMKIEVILEENSLHFNLDGELALSIFSHLPVKGSYFGFFYLDAHFSIKNLTLFNQGKSSQTSCLSIGDALLASKHYEKALEEYWRVSEVLKGYIEGAKALFKIGEVYLELSKQSTSQTEKEQHLEKAFESFSKLEKTPAAPLCYLGKSLVYIEKEEYKKEVECFEIAFAKKANNPLIFLFFEQAIYRYFQKWKDHRHSFYTLALISFSYFELLKKNPFFLKFLKNLRSEWEDPLFLVKDTEAYLFEYNSRHNLINLCAFWLGKEETVAENLDDAYQEVLYDHVVLGNGFFTLLELGNYTLAKEKFWMIQDKVLEKDPTFSIVEQTFNRELSFEERWEKVSKSLDERVSLSNFRTLTFMMDRMLIEEKDLSLFKTIFEYPAIESLDQKTLFIIKIRVIWGALKCEMIDYARGLIDQYDQQVKQTPNSILFFLYGALLIAEGMEEEARTLFLSVPFPKYPKTYLLGIFYSLKKIQEGDSWFKDSFMWERRHLYSQMELLSICRRDKEKKEFYTQLEKEQYVCI